MQVSPRQISDDLMLLLKHIKSGAEQLAEKYGLTHVQLYVLRAIDRGDMTMRQVASQLRCDASNVSGLIDRLVALGLVERHESEEDRRAKKLNLTAKGRELLELASDELPSVLGCDRLSPSERAALHELISRLVVAD
jgi:Transcriptional regulators